jgi:hypothetical protein
MQIKKSGDHLEDLAKFGYKPNMKPIVFWLHTENQV